MSSSTPTRPYRGSPHAAQPSQAFTPAMRDRQARGKDAYDDEHDEERQQQARLGRGVKAEPFEDREKRGYALSVLDSPEQLMMYAQSTGDSVPGQRLRFMAMVCGFEDKRRRDKDREREREKRRS